jgi:4-hydroxybenzoate polyprenyltransferase
MKAEELATKPSPSIADSRRWGDSLIIEIRPREWVKNLLVLAPLLFSQKIFVIPAVGQASAAFILFCLISSSVYLLNDLADCQQDRLHPQKCRRPIAAGELGQGTALGALLVLLLVALGGGMMFSKAFALVLLLYWLINLLYSAWLKHQVILDVFTVASGFVLRAVGGAVAIQVEMSQWLLICTTLLALFMGFSKRRHELLLLQGDASNHRQVLGEYNPRFLDMMIAIVTASTVMSYTLYTVSEETVNKFHTRGLILTLPFVLYGIFRYLYLVYSKDQGGNPTQNLASDKPMVLNFLLWALLAGTILYWQ